MNEKVVIKPSVKKQLLFIYLSIIFILGNVAISYKSRFHFIIGMIGIIISGFALVIFIKGLIRPKPTLVIDENGFIERFIGEMIYWNEVKSIHISKVGSERFLRIELKDYSRLLEGLTTWKRKAIMTNSICPQAEINLKLTDYSCEEVYEIMNRYWLAHQSYEYISKEQNSSLE